MTRHFFLVVLSVCLLCGCSGGGDDAAQRRRRPPRPRRRLQRLSLPTRSSRRRLLRLLRRSSPAIQQTARLPPAQRSNLSAAPQELAAHARGLSIVRPEHFAVVKLDMANARKSKVAQSLPEEQLKEMANNVGPGLDTDVMGTLAEKVDLLWAAIGPPVEGGPTKMPVSFALYLRANSPQAITDFLKMNPPPESETIDYHGQQYESIPEMGERAYYWHNGAEFFFAADEAIIKQAIDAGGKIADTPLLKKLAGSNLDADFVVAGSLGNFKQPATDALTGMLKQMQLPIPLHLTAGPLPGQIEYATIAIDLDDPQLIDIDADMDSPEAAENFKTSLAGLVGLGNVMLAQFEAGASDDPAVKEMFATAKKVLGAIKVENNDKHFDASLAHLPELDKLPEVLAAAGSRSRRIDELSNARQIGLAAANFHLAYGRRWPANIKDEDGNDLLSWRVAILPFVEEDILYRQVDRKAAWDSDANRELLDRELFAYKSASNDDGRLTTWKLLPEAPGGLMFISTGEGTEVSWAQPDNFVIDPANPTAALGPEPEGGYVVAYKDGRAMRMPLDELLAALGLGEAPAPTTDAPQARTWTDATGKFKIEAVLVSAADGKATLKRSDNGQEITIPIDKLSASDQEHLKSME